jgi:hypothetical protein
MRVPRRVPDALLRARPGARSFGADRMQPWHKASSRKGAEFAKRRSLVFDACLADSVAIRTPA